MATSKLNIQITAVDHASQALKSIQSGIIRLVGAIVALGAAFKAITFPAKAAADFEREMVNVAKTTGFTDSQIEKLSGTMIDLSKNMSVSATELAAIAAIAGQLGLGSFGVEAIEAFTESVAKASVTLGLSVEKAAEFGAQISSIFNLDPSNIENVFSTLNELSNTSVATAGQLADIIKRVGSVGGITLQQSAGLAAFFRDLGVQVEVAGTSTVKVLSNMSAKAKDFAKVAGLSMQQWTELMKKDTVSALTLVTSKLYEMGRAQRDATAKELFGGGRILASFTKVIDDAANGYERLYTHIDNANSSYALGVSSIEEYNKVMRSTTEQTKVMFNSMRALAIEMGEHLNPVMLDIVKSMQRFLASDEGRDFFFQMAEGIRTFITSIQSGLSYIEQFGGSLHNVIILLRDMLVVMLAISAVKLFIGLGSGVTKLVTSLAVVHQSIKAVLGLITAAKAASLTAAGGTALLTASLLPLLALLALVAAGLYYFKDALSEAFGFKSQEQIDLELQVRVDKRKLDAEIANVRNTLEEATDSIIEGRAIELEIPIDIEPAAVQEDFAEKTLDQLLNVDKVTQASEIAVADFNKVITDKLQTIKPPVLPSALDIDLGLSPESRLLEDLTSELDTLIVKKKEYSDTSLSFTSGALDAEALSLEEHIKDVSKAITGDFTNAMADKGPAAIREFIRSFDDAREGSQGLVDYYIDDIARLEDAYKIDISVFDELQRARENLADSEVKLLEFDNTETTDYIQVLREIRDLQDEIGEAEAIAKISVPEDDEALAALRSKLADEDIELAVKIAIDRESVESEIAKAQDAVYEAESDFGKGSTEAKVANDQLTFQLEKQKKLTEDLTALSAKYTNGIAEGKLLTGLSKVNTKLAESIQLSLKQTHINVANNTTAESSAKRRADRLLELTATQSIINEQIKNYDESVYDVIQTANRLNGAWDNIKKTIRALKTGMDNFKQSVTDTLDKVHQASAKRDFELGVDKETVAIIDDINTKFDEYIQKLKDSGRSDEYIQQFEKRKQLLIDEANEQAGQTKLSEQRKVAEEKVTKALEDQRVAQSDLSSLMANIQNLQDSGDFAGDDGLKKYNKAMLELDAANTKVKGSAKTAQDALLKLSGIEGLDANKAAAYEAQIVDLGTKTSKLTEQQSALNNELAESALATASSERSVLSNEYDRLGTAINELVDNNRDLVALQTRLREATDKAAIGMDTLGSSSEDTLAKLEAMKGSVTGLYGALEDVAGVKTISYNLDEAFQGRDANINIKIDKEAATKSYDEFVAELSNAPPIEVKTKIVVTEGTEGEPKFIELEAELVVPDEEAKNLLEGKPDTDVNLNVKEVNDGNPLELEANVKVKNAAGGPIQAKASGGSISGAGSGTSDSILSWLSNGEYVIKASSVAKFGTSFFDMLNSGSMPLPRFATGGGFNLPSSSTAIAGSSDSVDLNFNFNDQSYTLHGERKQAKAIVDLFKNMTRG